MILLSARIFRILLAVMVLSFGCWYLKKRVNFKTLFFFGIIIILLAVGSNSIANLLPPMNDQVTITALNEKREEARRAEVFLAGYTIDEKDFLSGPSLEIVDGHWFWSGESYAWRPETDRRQPDGLTRTIVINIPVGWNRILNFEGGVWSGKAAITVGDNTNIVDTYAEKSSIQKVAIGRSDTGALILNQIRYLAVYAIIFIGLSAMMLGIICNILRAPEQAKVWLEKNSGRLINGGIVLLMLILMFHWAGNFSLWLDELYELYFTAGTLKEAILCGLTGISANPPLETLFYTIWYHIAPYGEQWLLLPSMLLSAASIYLFGIIVEGLYGRYCSIFAVILAAFSTTLWTNVAYEYRAYAMFLFFATFTLFCHIRRNHNLSSRKWHILFSLSLTGMAMTHYWGMMVLTWYFFADLFLWRTKRITWKTGLCYGLPGCISIIWLATCQMIRGVSFQDVSGWYSIPNLSSVVFLLKFLSGDLDVFYWLLFLGAAIALTYFLQRKAKFSWSKFYIQFSFALVAGTILFVYIYGNYINPKNTMWADRYFLFLLPNIFLLSALPLYGLALLKDNHLKIRGRKALCLFAGLCLLLNCCVVISEATTYSLQTSSTTTTRTSEPFREAADWLYTQKNYIFNEETLIVTRWNQHALFGWNEYYVTQQGRRDELNTVSQYDVTKDDLLQYDRIYFFYRGSKSSYAKIQKTLDENYELEENRTDIRVRVYVRQ